MNCHARCRRDPVVQDPRRPDETRLVRAAVARGRAHGGSAHAAGRRLSARGVPAFGGFETGGLGQEQARRPNRALPRHSARARAAHQLAGALRRPLARAVRPARKATEGDGSMTDSAKSTQSIVEERLMPHSPEKVWRALTQSALIAQWLMQNYFKPETGHRFTFRAQPQPGWTGIVNCEVTVVEPLRRLVYTWGDGT